MPNTFLTRYRLVVNDLKELALDVKDIAPDTISEVDAVLAQYYLKQILEGLILATRIGHTGQYTDVLNPLVISTVGHSGNLLNQPSFATVASSGSDLANKPTIAAGLEKIEVCQGFAKLVSDAMHHDLK